MSQKIALLNPLESQYYYDTFFAITHSQSGTYADRLRQLNPHFLGLINTLTEAREKQIFTGWFAKINFIGQAYGLSETQADELQSLRRLLKRCIVNRNFGATEGQFWASLRILSELVAYFSEQAIPDKLKSQFVDNQSISLSFKEKPQDKLAALYATILRKGQAESNAQGEGQILLTCDTEDFGTIQITITDIHYHKAQTGELFRKYELSKHVATLIRPYQTIYLTDLERVSDNFFASTRETLLVASPDYLVDATAIANCSVSGIKSPYLYLLNKLRFFEGNEFTFSGNLINTMLDDLLETGEFDYNAVFWRVFREKQSEAVLLDLKAEQVEAMYFQLKPQFETLAEVMKNYADQRIITEPSFISGKYGLQGRIDMLVEYEAQQLRKDVIELKSTSYSNPQFQSAKTEHLLQVACYNLLLDSTFQQRQGVSAILYSRDSATPLRDCGKLNFEAQEAMWLRNCMVYIDWQVAQGDAKFYDTFIQRLNSVNLPNYKQDELSDFARKWRNASEVDKVYFAEFMGLVVREMLVAKVGGVSGNEPNQGFASLWRNSKTEKLDNFSLLSQLKIQEINPKKSEIIFQRPANQEQVTAFREGDIIVIYPAENEEDLTPQQFQLLKGNVVSVNPQQVKIRIWHKAVDDEFFRQYPFWAIEPSLMENSYQHQMASLADFLGVTREKKDLILGLEKPKFSPPAPSEGGGVFSPLSFGEGSGVRLTPSPSEGAGGRLSVEQVEILHQALSAQDYFLLQGPPGTGKTSKMLRTMVDYLYNQTQETIVLLAFTNRATDEICQKIDSVCGGNFIRLGSFGEESEFWDKSLRSESDLVKLKAKLAKNRVFVSTVASFYQHFNLIKNYDTLIVDEASQLLEPALCGILPKFRRFILIGDEKQLPAVVTQPITYCQTQNTTLNQLGIKDLSISVFERLLLNAQTKGWNDCYAMLNTQYRTHQDIAGFISQEFYKTLQIGSPNQQKPLDLYNADNEEVIEKLLSSKRVIFIPTEREENLKFNRQEAEKVVELLQTIRRVLQAQGKFTADSVGVITPYRAQIAEIYHRLDDELRQLVSIDTVERYQGSERDIILISMAVNHPAQMKNLQAFNGTMTVDKKLNVALSRAREQLILLGNPEVLKQGKFYERFLGYLNRISQ
ncbi:MAG: AAA domain-containing protein [Microscillaceae bacterium]|nr:AAA domain-containing protein [Microscillaceae bacterium]